MKLWVQVRNNQTIPKNHSIVCWIRLDKTRDSKHLNRLQIGSIVWWMSLIKPILIKWKPKLFNSSLQADPYHKTHRNLSWFKTPKTSKFRVRILMFSRVHVSKKVTISIQSQTCLRVCIFSLKVSLMRSRGQLTRHLIYHASTTKQIWLCLKIWARNKWLE